MPGLDDLGGQGRKRRITEEERSRIISLVKTVPPGRLRWEPVGELWAFNESGPPEWTLDSLVAAARAEGIEVGRSQVCRILLAEGVRWRRPRPTSSTPMPTPGSGADPHHQLADYGTDMCTSFEEPSTNASSARVPPMRNQHTRRIHPRHRYSPHTHPHYSFIPSTGAGQCSRGNVSRRDP
ncbi:hypothetical protein OG773_47150 [Streptomyces sp. NBC_00140]|nr:hypothetical protein [Streptomyces sp. NBC_00140]